MLELDLDRIVTCCTIGRATFDDLVDVNSLERVSSEVLVDFGKIVGTQVLQGLSLFLAFEHEPAHDGMRLAEGNAVPTR